MTFELLKEGMGMFRGMCRRRRGKAGKRPDQCICPHCRFTAPHVQSRPCFTHQCPECGAAMTRRFFPCSKGEESRWDTIERKPR